MHWGNNAFQSKVKLNIKWYCESAVSIVYNIGIRDEKLEI